MALDNVIAMNEEAIFALRPWISAVTGHHGTPPRAVEGLHGLASQRNRHALDQFARELVSLLAPGDLSDEIDEQGVRSSSWLLAGLCVVSDWLGSSQEFFPYAEPPRRPSDLVAYWEQAIARAKCAVAHAGLGARRPSLKAGMVELFPTFAPSPLQQLADEIPLGTGPQLFVAEDIAGAGKTEATLVLASRLMARGLGDGIYFALPTMATANGIFPRIRAIYGKLFDDHAVPSLILAHGAAGLQAKLEHRRWDASRAAEKNYAEDERSATAQCSSWIADSRKRSLLADIGVGTIDQALLSVLPVKHGSVRQLGLLGKILVVDEVHAYDPYMTTLLERLLEQHAQHGGSVILLSATLPRNLRARLTRAFAAGLPAPAPDLTQAAFPLLTHVASTCVETACSPREGTMRSIGVDFLHSEVAAVERLMSAVDSGKCAVWIRNTVRDATRAYDLLTEALGADPVELFHARFCLGDRLTIEQRVLDCFGATSRPESRRGRVVIGTQVVEQSLDLDFDEMVTDLAPIDLVIQRAGRLRRHARNAEGARAPVDSRGEATLVVLCPEWSATPGENWLAASDVALAEVVYRSPGLLWRTQWVLRETRCIRVPEGARHLVESVYGTEAPPIPEGLIPRTEAAQRKALEAEAKAIGNRLPLRTGYLPDRETWESEEDTPTRLTEMSQEIRLAVRAHGRVSPFIADEDWGVAWQLSSLSVPRRKLSVRSSGNDLPAADFAITVILTPSEDGLWVGEGGSGRGRVQVLYNRKRGLELRPLGEYE